MTSGKNVLGKLLWSAQVGRQEGGGGRAPQGGGDETDHHFLACCDDPCFLLSNQDIILADCGVCELLSTNVKRICLVPFELDQFKKSLIMASGITNR